MDASRKEQKETQFLIFMHFGVSFARGIHVKTEICTENESPNLMWVRKTAAL